MSAGASRFLWVFEGSHTRNPRYAAGMVRTRLLGLALLPGAVAIGCGSDFDATREVPKRKSLGAELYTLMCSRIGAQALREDISGRSYHDVCHADSKGKYATKVDATKLPALAPSEDLKGKPVTVTTQRENRRRRIARVEALARRREDLVRALDATLPDLDVVLRQSNRTTEQGCGPQPGDKEVKARFLAELTETISRFIDLYNDGTIPDVTRGLAKTLDFVNGDPESQAALARLEARQGYRPTHIALGLARPMLAYPRLFDLANTALRFIADDSDPYGPSKTPVPGKANAEYRELVETLSHELRVPDEPPPALGATRDDTAGIAVLSRPRSKLEVAREILLAEDDAFSIGGPRRLVVRRDPRGFAGVELVGGKVPGPFVDDGAGLPQLDELGRFVTVDGSRVATPFFALGEADGERDADGRAVLDGRSLFSTIDVSRTYAARALRDLRPLSDPAAAEDDQALMNILAGIPVLMGGREDSPTGQRVYPPLPGQQVPVALKYRKFDGKNAPIADLVHALGQTMNDPWMDDGWILIQRLLREHPQRVARLVNLGLSLKKIADAHPEAQVPENATIWDDFLETFAKIAAAPELLEAIFRAFGDARTPKLEKTFSAYMRYRDHLSYQKDPNDKQNETKLNGPPFNKTTGSIKELSTPVDRSLPDSGENRSALQKFIHLLHDADGLAACTKEGAVAHFEIVWPQPNGLKIKLNFPGQTPPEQGIVAAACALVGAPAPTKIPKCGILRLENVSVMLVDVALGRAKFDVREPCLQKIMANNALTGLVGGVEAFLENASGIKGFSTKPTVPGISRFVHFDTPYTEFGGYAGDDYYVKTRDFFKDILDPVPTMVCPAAPFKDTDGKVMNLRKCDSIKDTIRGRHPDVIFPLEQFGYVENIQPLAAAFGDTGQPLLFVELFDRMHLHWGSPKQTKEECDPTAPKTDKRWCSQDGAVTYEPLLAEMLESDLFPTMFDLVGLLKTMKIPHCEAWDAEKRCVKSREVDGVTVLAEVVRIMVDPARNAGIKNRAGESFALRNDGGKVPQTTPAYLVIDALKGFDKAFKSNPAPDAADVWKRWKLARSQIVDTFFAIDGTAEQSAWRNPAMPKLLPRVIDALREQTRAHCTPGDRNCVWAQRELVENMVDSIEGPTAATVLSFFEAVRREPEVRTEFLRLTDYLMDSATNDAEDTTLTTTADLMQVLADDTNLGPVYRVVSSAMRASELKGKQQKPLTDALVRLLSRFFARGYDDKGKLRCTSQLDPNETIGVVLSRLVTPAEDTKTAPIEVLFSVIADVNRADPAVTEKLAGDDYANITKEVSAFFIDEGSGLEQVYDLVREATRQ